METDKETAHDAIDAYIEKLNCAMRDSAIAARCIQNQKGIGALNLVSCDIVKGVGGKYV